MWNSGGKNMWSQIGRGLFGTRSDAGKAEAIYGAGNVGRYMDTQESELADLRKTLSGAGKTAWERALAMDTGEASEDALWKLQSRRLMEQLRPGLAARGLATSGAGINIEAEKLGELGTEFTSRAFERNVQRQQMIQQAAEGLRLLESMPLELRNKLIDSILSQSMVGLEGRGGRKGLLEQIGGGQGIGAMASSGG